MIKFLAIGLIRDKTRSLFPTIIITITVAIVIFALYSNAIFMIQSWVAIGKISLVYGMLWLHGLPLFLGLIWVGLDQKKQGWHDKLAGTLVVKR